MFSMPLQKINDRIRAIAKRTHNMPEDMRRAEIEEEMERNWQEVMGKAEQYRQGAHILEYGGWFSAMSLGNWITLCEAAEVEMIPSRLGGVVNPVMIFDIAQNGFKAHWSDDMQSFLQGFQDIQDDEIVRFDTCAPAEVKAVMTLGRDSGATPAWKGYAKNEAGNVFPKISDKRLIDNMMANPENASPVWIRKWVEPMMIAGDRDKGYQAAVLPEDRMLEGEKLPQGAGDLFPCEWRVYVKDAQVVAVSNYYTSTARGETPQDEAIAIEMARQARQATERLLDIISNTQAIPHHPMYEHRDGFDADGIHFSLDFLEARDDSAPMGRRLVMIEGGPAHLRNPNWGAHPTCFGVALDPEGVAFSVDDVRSLSILD